MKNIFKILVLTMLPFTLSAQFSGGNGSENCPYIITMSEQLAQLALYVNNGDTTFNNKHYKLGNDLDLSNYGKNTCDSAGWIPIGKYENANVAKPFKGVFDGNNKIITGLYINNTTLYDLGLFGYIEYGTIKNLGVVEVNINSNTNTNYCEAGGIAAYIHYGKVQNCYSTGKINIICTYGTSYASGVVGYNNGIVKNCYSTCLIKSFSMLSFSAYAGGVVGYNNSYVSTLSNCYSTGSVSSTTSFGNSFAGGVIGRNQGGIVFNCVALNSEINCTGEILHFGRVVGHNEGRLTNNIAYINMLNPYENTTWYNKGFSKIDGEDYTASSTYADGTLGGRFTSENGWTIENGKLPGLFGNTEDIPDYIIPEQPVIISSTLPAGVVGISYNHSLKANSTTVIWTLESGNLPNGLELLEEGIISGIPIIEGIFSFYVTATNLVGSDTKELSITILSQSFETGDGSENNPYIITTPQQLAQLALYVNNGDTIFNNKHYKLGNDIDLSNYCKNTCDSAGWIPIGKYENANVAKPFKGVFDGNNKIITGLYINNTTLYDLGLFGYIEYGTVKNLGVVEVNINSITNTNYCEAGGIAAYIHYGKVQNCYSTGKINIVCTYGTPNASGVVGYNNGIVRNCYSTCTLKSFSMLSFSAYAGGVVGYNNGYVSTLSNCYSTGSVSSTTSYGNSFAGGVIGRNQGGIVFDCVALNSEINCTGEILHFGRVIGHNEGRLANNIAYINMLNPYKNTTWYNKGFSSIDGEDYAASSIYADGTLGGRFTSENGWTVENGKLPGLFGNTVDIPNYIILEAPIIITSTLPSGQVGISYNQTLIASNIPVTWSLENGNLPDGLQLSNDGIISGTPTIEGIFDFVVAATNSVGVDTKELTIIILLHTFEMGDGSENNPYIITTPQQLAQLAQYVNDGNTNFNNKHYKLGNDLDLSNYCENTCDSAGWIPIGKYENANIAKPFKGVFDGNNKIISGLYINNTTLYDLGLFGYIEYGTVKNLGVVEVNINSITSTNYCEAGGIAAYIHYGKVQNCYSTGKINIMCTIGTSNASGVVGYNNGIVTNCYSTCTLNSLSMLSYSSYAGGVVGYNNGYVSTLSNCYSTGSVSSTSSSYGNSFAGGVIGRNQEGDVRNCVALNSEIKCSNGNLYFGRVIGYDEGCISNNIAFDNMINPEGDYNWYNIGASQKDGENITVEAINADCSFVGRFTSANGWTIENGKLPGLFGNVVDMPEHLRLPMLPVIITEILPDGDKYVVYNQTLIANSRSTIFWSLESGNMPVGLNLYSNGIISGTPLVGGIYNFTVRATNNLGFTTKPLSITINPSSDLDNNSFTQNLITYYQNGNLYISGLIPGEKWYIVDLSGRIIYEGVASADIVEMFSEKNQQIANGVYIIKSGSRAVKMVVK